MRWDDFLKFFDYEIQEQRVDRRHPIDVIKYLAKNLEHIEEDGAISFLPSQNITNEEYNINDEEFLKVL